MIRVIIRMMESILLPIAVTITIPGVEAHSIYACSGESVRLFQNISTKVSGTDTFLYKNSALIDYWPKFETGQEAEIFYHDDYGHIGIDNIDLSDDATYAVMQTIDDKHPAVIYEVRLIVLVAPDKSCRLQLKRDGNTLIASLETGAACGNPEATASWLDHPYLALDSQAKAKLSLGKEAGTYYACIETPALRCAGRFKPLDFCSSLTIDESYSHTGSTATATPITALSVLFSALLLKAVTNCFL